MSRRRAVPARRYAPEPPRTVAAVTVVIPCYNYARFLPAAVSSVLAQPGVAVDVVVVDDASTDDSVRVARELARDSRVRVLVNDANRGPVDTFNRGLAAATGEFVVRLDADDLLTPGSLARSVAVMQRLPRVGLVYGHPIHFEREPLPPARLRPRSWTVWEGRDWLAARCTDGTNVITSPEVVMRRSVVDRVGGQRPLRHTHDMEMWLRLAAHTDVAYIGGVDQAWHREHAVSLSVAAADPRVILREIRDAFDMLFDGIGVDDVTLALRADAHRAVARDALTVVMRAIDRGAITDAHADLLQFAAECDPAIDRTRAWRALSARIRQPPAGSGATALAGMLRRARRRLRNETRMRRWRRHGLYEPVRLI